MKTQPAGRFGPYLLVRELGRGGMGVVWEALHEPLGRRVALKLIRLEGAGAAEEAERVAREARALGRVEHPGVVTVHDTGVFGATAWIAMRLVPGETLRARLQRLGPYPPREAARLGLALAEALAATHAAGVVHRDIKPHNVLLEPDGRPVLTDFGLARLDDSRSLTVSGALLGTPAYMPPEQVQGQRADIRGDVYSLGATLYEALTGSPPFTGPSALTVLESALHQPPAPLRRQVPGISPGLEAVVLRCLEKDPARRPGSAGLLVEALRSEAQALEARAYRPLAAAAIGLLTLASGGLALMALSRPESAPVADAAPAVSERAATAPSAVEHLRAAEEALGRLDPEGSLACVASAELVAGALDQAVLLARARACVMNLDLKAARLALTTASQGPDRALCYQACLDLAWLEEGAAAAVAHLERAMRLDPQQGDAYMEALIVCRSAQRLDYAQEAERRAQEIPRWQERVFQAPRPSIRVRRMQASLCLRESVEDQAGGEEVERAIAILDQVLAQAPSDTTALVLRGHALARRGTAQGRAAARESFLAAAQAQGSSEELADLLVGRASALMDALPEHPSTEALGPARELLVLAQRKHPLDQRVHLAFSRWFELVQPGNGALARVSMTLRRNPCLPEAQERLLRVLDWGSIKASAARDALEQTNDLLQLDETPLAICAHVALVVAAGGGDDELLDQYDAALAKMKFTSSEHLPLARAVRKRVETAVREARRHRRGKEAQQKEAQQKEAQQKAR